ncbi:MAG: chemotaxis protein CheW [Pseudanabaenaceae cyanobacterium SKYGB_i_bin29]|nr:chemotaxis protein CheW [Pseudanabaenaceae cyanobacterium SKYG29]MDW8422563.1 chemotaxis protein CheW [Pseudanabaenaceae cyanobacterium SKYGB_i_bin29]
MPLANLKILIFPVGNLWLSLNLQSVKKVIPRPEIVKGKQEYLGLCVFDGQEVTVIDLYQKVLGQVSPQGKSYLIVLASPKGWYGLTVGSLPLMRDVPANQFHPVPPEYRERDTLNIASHVVQLPLQTDKPVPVFLLDENRLLELV